MLVTTMPANDNADAVPRKACPICGKPADATLKPFCSKRCADVDLSRWLNGVYAVPVVEDDADGMSPEDL
jgi:uncharacterized protein